jgi:hypothetical protein
MQATKSQFSMTAFVEGRGTLFTPGGRVRLTLFDVPHLGTAQLGTVAGVDQGGNVFFNKEVHISNLLCNADQFQSTVRAEVEDLETGRIATAFVGGAAFCNGFE